MSANIKAEHMDRAWVDDPPDGRSAKELSGVTWVSHPSSARSATTFSAARRDAGVHGNCRGDSGRGDEFVERVEQVDSALYSGAPHRKDGDQLTHT